MRDLTEIRQQIDQIDQKMLALFKERMGCSVEVLTEGLKDYKISLTKEQEEQFVRYYELLISGIR